MRMRSDSFTYEGLSKMSNSIRDLQGGTGLKLGAGDFAFQYCYVLNSAQCR